jgi:hypothetical protein
MTHCMNCGAQFARREPGEHPAGVNACTVACLDQLLGRTGKRRTDPELAEIRQRATRYQPLEPSPARPADWGKPLTWRDVDQGNCLRLAINAAFGLPLGRIPPRPSNPPDGWGDEFEDGLRRAGLHLELIPSRDLELAKGERWVALIIDHAVAMVGMRVLHDSARRWTPGERLDAPIICGYVRKDVRTDKWGKVLAA